MVRLEELQAALMDGGVFARARAGASCVGRGTVTALGNPALLRLALLPIAVYGVLYVGFGWVAWRMVIAAHAWLFPWATPDAWYGFFWSLASGLVWLLLGLVFFLTALAMVAVVGSILVSPFLEAISGRTEQVLLGGEPPPGPGFLESMVRTLRAQLFLLFLYLVGLACVALLYAIPGLGVLLGPPAQAALTLAFLAVQFLEWPAERRRLGVMDRVGMVRTHTAAVMGFGAACWLLMLLPFTPSFLAVGGTLLFMGLTARTTSVRS